jgi:hydroxyacylglutathione hydrolase
VLQTEGAGGYHDRMTPSVIPVALGIGKAFIVKGEGTVIVDAGMPGTAGRMRAALAAAGIAPRDVRLLLVTHGHEDHFGGCAGLRAFLSCPIAVHEPDAAALRDGRNRPVAYEGAAGRLVGRLAGLRRGASHPCTPDLVFSGALDLAPYGVSGRVEPTPGHTPGSITVFLEGGEAIVGDLLRGAMVIPGLPRWPFVVEDGAALRRSIARVLDQGPSLLWTSHGGPLAPDAVREFLRSRA